MKSVFLVITCVIIGNVNSQSLASFGLKGKVKSLEQEYEKCPRVALVGSDINSYEQKETLYFDKKGKQTYLVPQKEAVNSYVSEKNENKDGYVITKYLDNNGKRTRFNSGRTFGNFKRY